MSLPALRLKKHQDRRVRSGHLWVYSNELDTREMPLKSLQPGLQVELFSHDEKWLGYGYVNPHSLIAVRLVSRNRDYPFNESLLVHRLNLALALRERFYEAPYYRLVFGESDGLPGLVLDRFDDYLVVQITTAGMEQMREPLLAALNKVVKPRGILFRNDSQVREMEGLERYIEIAQGEFPETLQVYELGLNFQVPAQEGQKTGWFYDQAFNRRRLAPYVKGKTVLDVFSYVGAWGVSAAVAGATEVSCIDASATALEAVANNASLNGVDGRVDVLRGDAFDLLRELRQEHRRFDVVMVDPPAFIKRRKDIKKGAIAYRRINQLALQLLGKEGVLISSSCSHHLSRDELLQLVQQAGRHTDRTLQLLEQGYQSPDHPVHPAMPETAYLKSLYFRSLPTF